MTSVTVLGLGRMGSAMADRLAPDHDVRTWTRRDGGSPADAVCDAEVVLLCLYDAPACREVLTACLGSLSERATVVNTTTVSPREATDLHEMVTGSGAAYLHAPVLGSTGASAGGSPRILAGSKPSADVETLLAVLGETLVFGGAAEAAARKLVANGVLGDSLSALRRALTRGDVLGLPRDAVLDVVARGALSRFVEGKRDVLRAGGAIRPDDDISVLGVATQDLSWLADARLDVSPEVVADAAVLRPLHAYAMTHASGDPSYLRDAFLPTAHIEGYRDGEFSSWDLEAFAAVFNGPAPDEAARSRRVERLDARGSVATAVMTLHHVEADFTDVFVLLRRPDGEWRIANKAYERRVR